MRREVEIGGSILRNRDGVDSRNVGDRVQLVETERGLRSMNPNDHNARLVDMRVSGIRVSTYRDRKTGQTREVHHYTLREEA